MFQVITFLIRQLRITTIFIIAILAPIGLSSCRLWRTTDSSSPNIKVQFIDAKTGWIVGPKLIHTNDGGVNWSVVNNNNDYSRKTRYDLAEYSLKRVQFITSQVGWILGENEKAGKIVKTVDGGKTWPYEFDLPQNQDDTYLRPTFFFLTTETGWFISSNIYRTKDGGMTWEILCRTPGVTSGGPSGILWFINSEHGILGARDKSIYITLDGGKTWDSTYKASSYIYDIFFYNNNFGWVVGSDGNIVRSVDGGLTWEKSQVPTVPHLYSVFFITPELGWAVGRTGTAVKEESNILYSVDGGATWQESIVKGLSYPLPTLVSVSFTDNLHGWAVGGADKYFPSGPRNLIIYTIDGGKTWNPTSLR